MKVVAVIPARGGSKRVPRKNLREVGMKPLIAWSILAAKAAHLVDRVIVSTDDAEIATVADLWGAEVHTRLKCDADDFSPIEAALKGVDSLCAGEGWEYDWMVTLQPTVPFRRAGLIDDCIKRACELDANSVFTAQAEPRCWFWEVSSGGEWMDSTFFRRMGMPRQRQEASQGELFYRHDGSVCVSSPAMVRRMLDRFGGRALPFVCPRTVDIDTEADLDLANALASTWRAEAA